MLDRYFTAELALKQVQENENLAVKLNQRITKFDNHFSQFLYFLCQFPDFEEEQQQ